MSTYPETLDALATDVEDREYGKTGEPDKSKPTGAGFHAQLHNHVNEAVMAIEQTLGLEPQGEFADVAARLVAIDAAIAGGDNDLTNAVATLTSAINAKQDTSTAATDSELATAVETINSALALKQDASSAATDSELLTETGAREAADASEAKAREVADAEEASARQEADATEKAARESGDSSALAAASAAQATADAALPKSGGTMTGTLTLAGDGSTNLQPVTKQQLTAAINALINGAPEALDTLKEISDRLGLDESAEAALVATVATKLAKSANLSDVANAATALANLGGASASGLATEEEARKAADKAERERAEAAEPTPGQKNALAGANGTPGSTNKYLTEQSKGGAGVEGKVLAADDAFNADGTLKSANLASSAISGSPAGGVPAWAKETAYRLNQLVSNEEKTYICLKAHTSGEAFSGAGANWALFVGAPGPIGLLPTDSRISSKIDTTGVSYCDAGWKELLALAVSLSLPIQVVPGQVFKFEKPWSLPHEVQFICPGGKEGSVVFKFPIYKKAIACAATPGTVSAGATEVKGESTYGSFAESGTAFIENATGAWDGSFNYTSITVEGKTTIFKGVTGFNGTVSTKNNIVQGCLIYAQQSGATCESLPPAITVEGPTSVTSSNRKEAPPTEIPAGVVLGSGRRLNCRIKKCCHGTVFVGNHQRIGKEYATSSCWSSLAWIGPSIQTGNQVIEATANCDAIWCSWFVAHNATIQAVDTGPQVHMGNTAFPIWREANPEEASSFKDLISGLHMDHPIFETIGSGIIGTPDGKSSVLNLTMRSPSLSLNSSNTPAERTPRALFECSFEGDLVITEASTITSGWFATYESCFLSDEIVEANIDDFKSIVDECRTKGIPLVKGKNTTTPTVRMYSARDGIKVSGSGTSVDSEIKAGDLVSVRENMNKVHRIESLVPVAGVALLDVSQRVVTYATPNYGNSTANTKVKVNVMKRSTPPTSPSAEANATAGTLEARAYFAKIVHELSGGGITAATAEVSATAEANKSIKFKWTNAASLPHGQTIVATRVYIGTATGAEAGYVKLTGTGTELLWSGAAKTGATAPPTTNTGCEIYGKAGVRSNGSEESGKACVSTGPADNNGYLVGSTYESPDNGETAEILMAVV